MTKKEFLITHGNNLRVIKANSINEMVEFIKTFTQLQYGENNVDFSTSVWDENAMVKYETKNSSRINYGSYVIVPYFEQEEKTIPITLGYIKAAFGWSRFCDVVTRTNPYMLKEFAVEDSEIFNITKSEAKELGIGLTQELRTK